MTIAEAVQWQFQEVIHKLRCCEDSDQLREVRNQIELVRPLWFAAGFAEVAADAQQRFIERAGKVLAEEEEFLAGLTRSNDKLRGRTEGQIRKVRELIDTMK